MCEEKVILVRDRIGKKTLYYFYDKQGRIIFKTHIKLCQENISSGGMAKLRKESTGIS